MRISKQKMERMASYNQVLKQDNVHLNQEELFMVDLAVLNRGPGVEVLEILDDIISKHKEKQMSKKTRKVHKCSPHSGRIIKTFSSISLAAKEEFGDVSCKSAILNCCAGRAKTYKSWSWKYAN